MAKKKKAIVTPEEYLAELGEARLKVPEYSIEIVVSSSKPEGVLCGAICVYQLNKVVSDDLTNVSELGDLTPDTAYRLDGVQRELQEDVNRQTDVMLYEPEKFNQREGRWLPWAFRRSLEISDRLGGDARLSLKCPKLKIHVWASPEKVRRHRSDLGMIFPVRQVTELLTRGFSYDPWRQSVRRGRIGADVG